MKIDWQEYEDGSMSEEARKHAEERLKSDPKAQQELAGLRSFRKAVRQAGMTEKVPMNRLEGMLAEVTGQSAPAAKPNLVRRALVPTFAAAAVLALAWVMWQPKTTAPKLQASTPVVQGGHLINATPEQARTWAVKQVGEDIPVVKLAGMACSFESVHCSNGWACWDFKVDGEMYHVAVKKQGDDFKGWNPVEKGSETYMINTETNWIGWRCSGRSFFVAGGNEETRWKVAEIACSEAKGTRA